MIFIGYSNANTIQFVMRSSGALVVNSTFTVSDITQFSKIAFKYKENSCSFWIDGVEVGTSVSTFTLDSLNNLNFNQGSNSDIFFGKVKQLQIYKTTDIDLAALTS